jgi:hypothetical protein
MDEHAGVYYPCTSCRRKVRDDVVVTIEEYDQRLCPDCAPLFKELQRLAREDSLGRLPDFPAQRLGEGGRG